MRPASPEESALERFAVLGLESPYRETRDGITPFVIPTVLTALYYFLRSPTDYTRTVRGSLLVGGDVDTVASIAGALSGAFNGANSLPKHLVECVLHRDRIIELADRLYALKEERRAQGT